MLSLLILPSGTQRRHPLRRKNRKSAPPERRRSAVLLLCALLTTLPNASANASQWQLGTSLMGGATRVGPTPSRGQIGTGSLIDGVIDGGFPERAEWDSGAAASVELALVKQRWRFTGAFSWHFRSDWDLSAPTPSIATVTNVFTNLERAAYLLGAHYRQPLSQRWELEIGAGGGVVSHKMRTDFKVRAVPNGAGALVRKSSSSERTAGWFAQGGFSYHLSEHLSTAVHYRYLNTGAVSIAPLPDRASTFRSELSDHLLVFSLRYRFR